MKKSAVRPIASSETSTQTVRSGKGNRTITSTTKTSTPAAGHAATETTTTSGGESFAERVLGDHSGVLLRMAAVLLAAFVAAAALQRVLVGQYGGIKVGSLEVADLATASDEAVKELKDALGKLQQESSAKLQESEAALQALTASLATAKADRLDREAALNQSLAVIAARLATIETPTE